MLRVVVRCLCVLVCCGWQYAVCVCEYVAGGSTLYVGVSMLLLAVRCMCVLVCCGWQYAVCVLVCCGWQYAVCVC
jgi:hypothetical protein